MQDGQTGIVRQMAALAALLLATGGVAAQEAGEHPARGAYGFASVGAAQNVSEPGFVTCRCREDTATGGKVGGGYRFGVPAVEAFWVDFGSARFGADGFGPATDAHVRGLVIAAAWSGRYGRYFELTGRAGAAYLETSASGQATARDWRPLLGGALGWRLNEAVTAELTLDLTWARDAADTLIEEHLLGLGLRYKF
ncbi:hypothetical protein [Ideonella sp.]|uniref:hypothetical protein n=1 Tax=Ideonella sp. TaxID=1929293 RepID=UPI002B49D23E|nr:hypothetical protein [Ideonella sp.]HJV70480.1 hypothetical protein [Ideonella sp.]